MTPEQFQDALLRIDSMATAGLERSYWCGFKRGLQRAYLGRSFSSNTDHHAWLDFPQDGDPWVAALGRGYRDGLEAVIRGGAPTFPVIANDEAACAFGPGPR